MACLAPIFDLQNGIRRYWTPTFFPNKNESLKSYKHSTLTFEQNTTTNVRATKNYNNKSMFPQTPKCTWENIDKYLWEVRGNLCQCTKQKSDKFATNKYVNWRSPGSLARALSVKAQATERRCLQSVAAAAVPSSLNNVSLFPTPKVVRRTLQPKAGL